MYKINNYIFIIYSYIYSNIFRYISSNQWIIWMKNYFLWEEREGKYLINLEINIFCSQFFRQILLVFFFFLKITYISQITDKY